jgi:UDP-N-acetylmuramoyl-L-alanyl-D-glutamate--2,6-diaminopimelate ligase
MKLRDLLTNALGDDRITTPLEDAEVKGITADSRAVKEDFVFVAIKGTSTDGHKFIEEAIKKGARAIIAQSSEAVTHSYQIPFLIKVKDTRIALAKLAAEFYANPSAQMKVVGITGTNGKTTVTYLIEAIVKEAGFSVGVIGTVDYRFKNTVIPSKNTTPGPLELQSLLAEMSGQGINYAVMEVSSHALAQDRVEGIKFYSAIFTNITQDHLDYHRTKEEYFQAKSKLFRNIHSPAYAVINNDDLYSARLKELNPVQIITYGITNESDIMARDIKFDISHTEFILRDNINQQELKLKTPLIGIFNAYNILSAVTWALKDGLDLKTILSALEKFSYVPGRLERIDSRAAFEIFVDYAHTEDALKNVISTLRHLPHKRLIVVFGCGGERDRTKRPKMGFVVTESADFVVITSDNPRSETPEDIIADIKHGIKKDNYCVVVERGQAIKRGLSLARAGDIVLLAGKGHENYQILKDKRIEFDDREVARQCLKSTNY